VAGKGVLIIGAGASVPFGIASGLGMMDQLCEAISCELENWDAIAQRQKGSQLKPFLLTLAITDWPDSDFFSFHDKNVEALEQLKSLLENQTSDTLDDLIRMNNEQGPVLKRAIAFCVFSRIFKLRSEDQRHYTFELISLEARKIGMDNANKRRNWIHHFINLSRRLALSARAVEIPTIVSFNYDGILEHVLEKQWNNMSNPDLEDWSKVIKIIHPHGVMKIEAEKYDVTQATAAIKVWANQIRIVDETQPAVHMEVHECRAIILEASNVYGAGFAFAESNCELIGLYEGMFGSSQSHIRRKLHFVNYDDSYGLRERAKRYCALDLGGKESTSLIERRPDKGGVLEIDEAIASGLLGEMPA
jgi:hypothetical protein